MSPVLQYEVKPIREAEIVGDGYFLTVSLGMGCGRHPHPSTRVVSRQMLTTAQEHLGLRREQTGRQLGAESFHGGGGVVSE